MSTRELLSVGIDIGTTTTQVIFSRLTMVNRATVSQVPCYEFVRREVIWQSPIMFTPVDFDGVLRENDLLAMILDQYRAADIDPKSIDSGAIIITGETAKTRNARPAIVKLAQTLGDFVVATAGPHLESVIAAQGAGSQQLSQELMGRVLNIDIGGGTSNYALFDAGRLQASCCLNVGGRLLETDQQGHVLRAHTPGKWIVASEFGDNVEATSLNLSQLNQVAERMSSLLWEVINNALSPLAQKLLMTHPLPDCSGLQAITLSGGVGACYAEPDNSDDFRYGDIGPLLAKAIHRDPKFAQLPIQAAKQTARATVIGAGAHTLSLSGSTIWVDTTALPLRNIPVVHPNVHASTVVSSALIEGWIKTLTNMDLVPERDLYALALPESMPVDYQSVCESITALKEFSSRYANVHPLLVIARQDFGKTLGMLLQPEISGRQLAVIDEVVTHEGDYIDIGIPFFGGMVVPITVKSLAFPT